MGADVFIGVSGGIIPETAVAPMADDAVIFALARTGREWESFYRDRWQHDRVVRSTHGVNCTGSCSWKIHVKDGIVAWETQQTDYPSNGPDVPEYEPRGCPRGASFSWYVYSPLRVRYPYVRGSLLEMYRDALARTVAMEYSWCKPPNTDFARTSAPAAKRWRVSGFGMSSCSFGGSGTPGPSAYPAVRRCNVPPNI